MDNTLKQKALKQLALAGGAAAQTLLNKEADKIAAALQAETRYDLIDDQLELLDTIAYRVHEKAVEIAKALFVRLTTLTLTYQEILGYPAEKLSEYQNNNTLIGKALETLEHIRYHQPAAILDIFFQYSTHANTEVAKKAIHGIEMLAGFDRDIFYGDGKDWPGLGWEPQEKVIEKINSFSDTDRRKFFSGIIAACNKILSPTIEGTNWTYKSVTISTGAVPAIQGIKDIRQQALAILQNLYGFADTLERKKTVLSSMNHATHTPHTGYKDDVLAMVMQDTASILQFMKTVIAGADLLIVQKIEHDAYFFYRRGANENVKALALEVKALIDAHAEYQIFKILIGFQGVFRPWDETQERDHEDFEREQALREEKAKVFAASITADDYPAWKARILNYASIKSDDMAMFPYFAKFLEHFGNASPALALRLLSETSEQLEGFIIPILCGVWETTERENAKRIITTWIDQGRYLFALARLFEYTAGLDEVLLKKIYAAAVAANNFGAINQVILTISAQYNDTTKHLIQELFLPALEILTGNKNSGWIFGFWFRKQRSEILADMDAAGQQRILDNLFHLDAIDYQAEEILCRIAEKFPALVVKFFCDRIAAEKEEDIGGKKEPIPFSFHKLAEPLSKIPVEAVDIVLATYDGDYGMFIYRGGRLLKNIFPNPSELFINKLIQLVRTKDEKNLLFVLAILRGYEGQPFLHEVCKELVKVLPEGGKLLNEVSIILQTTGVVWGAYGFAEAHQRKIEEIKPWLDDTDDKIKQFARKYIAGLEKQIEVEKKRADEDIMLRKHRYGDATDEKE